MRNATTTIGPGKGKWRRGAPSVGQALGHGECINGRRSPEYNSYMLARSCCCNPKNPKYPSYGERGIEFRFKSFEDFLSAVGRRPSEGYTVNRIDNNGHYERGNVEWATRKKQQRNMRSNRLLAAGNETYSLIEWAERTQQSEKRLNSRLRLGWCIECALFLTAQKSCPHKNQNDTVQTTPQAATA